MTKVVFFQRATVPNGHNVGTGYPNDSLVTFYFFHFYFRSANYNPSTGECSLSLMSRYTLKGPSFFERKPGYMYLENNCVDQAIRMCEFHKLPGDLLFTCFLYLQQICCRNFNVTRIPLSNDPEIYPCSNIFHILNEIKVP